MSCKKTQRNISKRFDEFEKMITKNSITVVMQEKNSEFTCESQKRPTAVLFFLPLYFHKAMAA